MLSNFQEENLNMKIIIEPVTGFLANNFIYVIQRIHSMKACLFKEIEVKKLS